MKLSNSQTNHTTTEQELFSIVDTLKELRDIQLIQRIKVFTYRKNIVHAWELKTSQRVVRWRLFLEEYGPENEGIKWPENTVAAVVSRFPIQHYHSCLYMIICIHRDVWAIFSTRFVTLLYCVATILGLTINKYMLMVKTLY